MYVVLTPRVPCGVWLAPQHPVGGVVGLIIAMMVEVLLYAIIADRAEQKQRKRELKDKNFAAAREVAARAAQEKWADEHSLKSSRETRGDASGASEGLRRRRGGTSGAHNLLSSWFNKYLA